MGHRRTRRIYDEALTFEKLYAAWNTVRHTCKNEQGLYEFALHAHVRIAGILETMKARKYWPGKFRCFMIFEPKPRLVMSQAIKDKVVNHFVAREYLLPLLEDSLIDTNVATRKEMGAKRATKMIRRYVSQMLEKRPGETIYALKVDVSKFFYAIDHEVLFDMLQRKVKDKDVIEILRRIVDETDKPYINKVVDKFNEMYGTEIPHYEKGKGLSIGAMTSQFLAIFYLNGLDHKIKEEYKQRYYVRYMDDLLILGWDKKELMGMKRMIGCDLEELKLKMNPKSAMYNCCSAAGFPFLGYRYYVKGGTLKVACLSGTVRRVRRRLKMLHRHNPDKYGRSYEAYRGYFLNAWPKKEIEEMVSRAEECFESGVRL